MKAKFEIQLEVPDDIRVYDPTTGENVSSDEQKEFIQDYFLGLKKIIEGLGERITNDEYEGKLEEFYNEDGELPPLTLEIKETLNDELY